MMSISHETGRGWTFLTNHAHVLVCIASDPGIRIQDIALQVGITLRAAQGIVSDLVDAGYVSRTRVGRRNQYEIHPELPFRHPLEQEHRIGGLLETLGSTAAGSPAVSARPRAGARVTPG